MNEYTIIFNNQHCDTVTYQDRRANQMHCYAFKKGRSISHCETE